MGIKLLLKLPWSLLTLSISFVPALMLFPFSLNPFQNPVRQFLWFSYFTDEEWDPKQWSIAGHGLGLVERAWTLKYDWIQTLEHCCLQSPKEKHWSIVALLCCVSFYYIAKWISCTYTYSPPLLFFLSFLLGHRRALRRIPCAKK